MQQTVNQTLQDAVDTWGENAQIDMAVEESAELITALSRLMRGRADEEDVVEEIADVQVMLDQLALIFDDEAIRDEYERKIDRLEDRLAEAEK